MSPLSNTNGSNGVVLDAAEDGIGQPVGAQELSDILDRVQFGSKHPGSAACTFRGLGYGSGALRFSSSRAGVRADVRRAGR